MAVEWHRPGSALPAGPAVPVRAAGRRRAPRTSPHRRNPQGRRAMSNVQGESASSHSSFFSTPNLIHDRQLGPPPQAGESHAHSHAHGADDAAHQYERDEPVAAVDPYKPPTAHGEAVVDHDRGEHEAEPAEG